MPTLNKIPSREDLEQIKNKMQELYPQLLQIKGWISLVLKKIPHYDNNRGINIIRNAAKGTSKTAEAAEAMLAIFEVIEEYKKQ